ncbi:MAG: (2Fe-2S)-binding protein [Rhodospirillales bacterium 20-60-12]|nr:MAG: (2Fe-2S)-binding protein [Rhodospirillales bacterium 20-60-12]HQT67835.1 (2Fe-2S)-binding protein [Acetobacteraceae bacterium]HQU01611.1 (2Fe-2S)-binding protein [Acetobacteraceae bacterium]
MTQTMVINVNGQDQTIEAEPDSMLLYALRDNLGLHGPKFGCGLSQCGACTIIMNGVALHSCVTPLAAAQGQKITTLEGLSENGKPNPLQQAFIDEQAAQCGYCINGMIMTAQALIERKPHASRDDIKAALQGNLCRCGTHMRILRAVERVTTPQAQQGAGQ